MMGFWFFPKQKSTLNRRKLIKNRQIGMRNSLLGKVPHNSEIKLFRLRSIFIFLIVFAFGGGGAFSIAEFQSGEQPSATLLIEAYDQYGDTIGISGFNALTTHVASTRWSIFENYGVFPLETPPTVSSAGSCAFSVTINEHDYVAMTVPSNQPLYFTCLWMAKGIGTVMMHADNLGQGFVLEENQSFVIELPYEFALSEHREMEQIFTNALASGHNFSADIIQRIELANSSLTVVEQTSDPTQRAIASYDVLSSILLIKEDLVLEISESKIEQTGYRSDFILNYNGFGSWTNEDFRPQYFSVQEAGFTSVYLTVDWKQVVPEQGIYDFYLLDWEINLAISLGFDVHIQVMPSVGSLPDWTKELSFEDLKTFYYENAQNIVNRYKDKVALFYAIGEAELNTRGYEIAHLTELVDQSLKGARSVAPEKPFGVFLNAPAYIGYQMHPPEEPEFVSTWDLIENLIEQDLEIDFFGVQMQYGTIFASIDLQRIQKILLDLYELTHKPIYISEATYSSKTEDYGIETSSYWHDGLSQHTQAEYAEGLLKIAYANHFIKGLSWTHMDPDDNDYGSDFLTSLIGTSLFSADNVKKLAYFVFNNFVDDLLPSNWRNWIYLDFIGTNLNSLAIDPTSDRTVYAGSWSSGVYKSTNGGDSWISINSGLTNSYVYSLAIDPITPQIVYAGTHGGVFKSTDGGDTWSATNSGLINTFVYSIAIDPLSPQTVYVGTLSGIFKSSTGGNNWSPVNTGITDYFVYSLAIDPVTPQTVYAGTFGGVFKSTDGGNNWSETILNDTGIQSLALDPSEPQTIYAGSWSSGVYKSKNGGENWTAINSGLANTHVNSLAIDPVTPQTVYAGTHSGAFKSANGGDNWSEAGMDGARIISLIINPEIPWTVYAGTWNTGVFRLSKGKVLPWIPLLLLDE